MREVREEVEKRSRAGRSFRRDHTLTHTHTKYVNTYIHTPTILLTCTHVIVKSVF